ncbi:MAG: GNAT family N-acetyltransferase [Oscillospiraceae bacterium]|nr:GNAT family N-acetyltransferase [Oscillospiraceae bacterium]
MKFDLAKKADLTALTKLWQCCFGDEPAQIRSFWDATFSKIQVFVIREGQQIPAMVCVLPTTLVDEEGESHSCGYFYAVCTHPAARGKGLCKKLMDYAQKHCNMDYASLVPAEESLFPFYEAMGYKIVFFNREYTVTPKKGANIRPASAEVYRSIRELQLYDNFLSYDEFLLPCAGSLYRIETAEGLHCACAYTKGKELLIRELLPDSPEAAAALCAHLGCHCATVRTMGEDKPFGMLLPLKGQELPCSAYLGLAFD